MQSIDIKNFQESLGGANSVLIVLAQNPSFDAVAAALSLDLALSASEKDVTVVCATPMIVEFNRLVGVDKVTDKLGGKNLVISFDNYDVENIEKVSYNAENGKFMLVVSPKSGATAPSQEQVKVDYKGIAADLMIVVGAQNKNDLGKLSQDPQIFTDSAKITIVGNEPAQGFSSVLEMINPQRSSVSEVAFEIIETLGLPIDRDIATNLFMGLREGTRGFTGKVNADTFATAARLVKSGANAQNTVQPTNNQVQEKPVKQYTPAPFRDTTLP